MPPTQKQLQYVINHVFLPSKLPQSDDSADETVLFSMTIDALTAFRSVVSGATAQEATDKALLALAASKAVHSSKGISETALRQALTTLKSSLTLHVKEQNAGLIITKIADNTTFEQFELAPKNANVLACAGRLIRTFPASAISIANNALTPEALSMIAQTLSTLSMQAAPGMQPQSSKSGQKHDESRDTTHPGMISEYFMSLLLPLGSSSKVSAITKRTREEVLWSNARLPFRRSPLWLLIRVTIQLIFSRMTLSSDMYKLFVTFLMSRILKLSLGTSTTTVYFMEATIARRLLKLPDELNTTQRTILNSINTILLGSTEELSSRWRKIQAMESQRLDMSVLGDLQFEQDALVAIPQLDTYIQSLKQRTQLAAVSTNYTPSARLVTYPADQLPDLQQSSTSGTYLTAKLQAFEQWVSDHLPAWLSVHTKDALTCGKLADVLEDYYAQASAHYEDNPEAFSILLLTTLEIWVACDKAAIAVCPMLREYNAGVPVDTLQTLLLPFKAQMTQLCEIEVYLHSRCGLAELKDTSLLYNTSSPESFGARYFDSSPAHKEMHAQIDQLARETRAKKFADLEALQAEYRRLSHLIETTACETETTFNDYTEEYDVECLDSCHRCEYESQREALNISSHEWPLPRNLSTAKVVTFELRVPQWYARWRDGTRFLLQKVLHGQEVVVQPITNYGLSSDVHLKKYYVSAHHATNIGLLSQFKPFKVTHWNSSRIGTVQKKDVCVPNGLSYQYFDTSSNSFWNTFSFEDEVTDMTTYQLPPSYQALQKFLVRPFDMLDGPPPNEVIASQADCHPEMSLQEFKELASLPLGHRIQWDNILLQLNAPSIDFKKSETTFFVLQCIYQVGPPNDEILRAAHHSLADPDIAQQVIQLLNKALDRVKENWESSQAISVFVTIATRVLSLNANGSVRDACFLFLCTARKILYDWVQLLRRKSHGALDTETRTLFCIKSVEIALFCAASFDMSKDHLSTVLTSADSASMLIQCSITIHDGWESIKGEAGDLNQLLHFRFGRILHRCYDILAHHTLALDHAMSQAWSAYTPGTRWTTVSSECPEWVTCMTADVPGAHALQIHYNTISGKLLVCGKPLNTPPKQYTEQALYSTLFSNHPVEVMPSMAPGMQYSTKKSFDGYSVHMGMKDAELVVRASGGVSTVQTLPSKMFQGIFPQHFEQDFVHWYDYSTGSVQFRVKSRPWCINPRTTWILREYGSGWRLEREKQSVVALKSRTSSVVTRFLEPLSVPTGIHITLNSSSKSVDIQIPALQLDFVIPRTIWCICSKQYRGMRIDEDQSLGTLHGLENRLLLRGKGGRRQLLLPEAKDITYRLSDLHVSVGMGTNAIHKLHLFEVDKILGRLSDDGSIHAKLYIAYLHALTSFCLPDPLTSMTGTEQALSILRSAGVASFDQLSEHDIDVLANIAKLTPFRTFYPLHLKQMQTVTWDSQLCSMSQHCEFVDVVAKLLDQHDATGILYPGVMAPTSAKLKYPDKLLAKRDRIRSSTIRTDGFGAEHHTAAHDVLYKSRDRDQTSQRAENVFHLSNMIYHNLSTKKWPVSRGYLWEMLGTCKSVLHPNTQALGINRLKYDISLMRTAEQTQQSGTAHPVQINWLSLHNLIAHSTADDPRKYAFMSFVTTMGWSSSIDRLVLQCLCLIFTTRVVADVVYPAALTSDLSPAKGTKPTEDQLTSKIKPHLRPYGKCPESSLAKKEGEFPRNRDLRAKRLYALNTTAAVNNLAQALLQQWPIATPVIPTSLAKSTTYIDVVNAMKDVSKLFKPRYDNMFFHQYLSLLEQQIDSLTMASTHDPTCVKLNAVPAAANITAHVSKGQLFLSPDEQTMQSHKSPALRLSTIATSEDVSTESSLLLSNVVAKFCSTADRPPFELKYIAELEESIMCLRSYDGDQKSSVTITLPEAIEYHASCVEHVTKICEAMVAATTSGLRDLTLASRNVQQWPRVSPLFFLQQLSHGHFQNLSSQWRMSIIRYGLTITALQRAARIVKLAESGTSAELAQELQHSGHENWRPEDFPSSLLMEIEGGFLIRPVQEQVAAVMRKPSGTPVNATVQLNMGAGKSSVIVPIVAAALTYGSKLVRVVVAKPQSKQMAQMLLSKLGGILNRRVYYFPISRAIKLDIAGAAFLGRMVRDCMSSGGILLVQPEHILSFKLMGLESFIAGKTVKTSLGLSLASTQNFLDSSSRDIVDESDENFSPRFEICYTMSSQRTMELCPERWLYIQQVFDLVEMCAPLVAREYPDAIMINPGSPGQFPRVRILRREAATRLIDLVALQICDAGLPSILKISRQGAAARHDVYIYLTRFDLKREEAEAVEKSSFWTATTSPVLLLLRGLLAGGVLAFALGQKRWRVNYGLADRTPPTKLAVPYRAKDNPSARSEYSHPDVVLTLTMLSYYYQGLTDDYLFTSLSHLMESDQKDTEYAQWMKGASQDLPAAFHGLEGINIKDREQCSGEIFPAIRHSKEVVDYFCSKIVFPKEMKEFPHKLSSSGWDLGKLKKHPLTGFSGTKDSRALLPLNVQHLDLPEQRHTNALVLEYLLQRENSVKMMRTVPGQSNSEAENLLKVVLQLQPEVQVILDVGAQIIEMDNLQVAQAWLRMHHDQSKQGAVFCNDNDELCVVDRNDRVELLQTSSFNSRLGVCLIFLDEAHTRGIDLRLPQHFRAAVTLGANLIKDKLVQACMRMRKLGKGQTVVFIVSPEIDRKIRESVDLPLDKEIAVSDVLQWSICETFDDLRRTTPLWAMQGKRHIQHQALWDAATMSGKTILTKSHAEKFLEEEAQSIERRYRPAFDEGSTILQSMNASGNTELVRIADRCREFDNLQFTSTTLLEEQERELSPEIEQERQVERPASARAAPHVLHPDVLKLWLQGTLAPGSSAFRRAFETLQNTSAAADFDVSELGHDRRGLLVTEDFARTVKEQGPSFAADSYQRPVQWIISIQVDSTITDLIIVSPFEANALRHQPPHKACTMHLFKARWNVSYAPLDSLDFYTIPRRCRALNVPRSLAIQLNLFAGSLYITSHADYLEICRFLGLAAESITAEMSAAGWEVAADGFIVRDAEGRMGGESELEQSPVRFVGRLARIRKNGEGVDKTHMGALLDGKLFRKEDWEA